MNYKFSKTNLALLVLGLFLFSFITSCTRPVIHTKSHPVNKKPEPYAWIVQLLGPTFNSLLTSSSFSDSTLIAVFKVSPNFIKLQMKNNTKDSLHILWNECTINLENKKLKIMHSNLTYEKRNNPLDFQILAPNEMINYFIAPKKKVYWNHYLKKWRSSPFFESGYRRLERKKFVLNMVFHKKGKQLEYPFEFKIQKVFPISFDLKNPFQDKDPKRKFPIIHEEEKPIDSFEDLPKEDPMEENPITEEQIENNDFEEDKEDYANFKDEETVPELRRKVSKSQMGINSLLNRLSDNSTDWEEESDDEDEDDEEEDAGKAIDSLAEENIDMSDNIPLFPDEKSVGNKDSNELPVGLQKRGIGSM